MDGLTFLTNLFDLSRQQLYVSLTPTNVINILKLFQLHISSQLISSQVKRQWSIDMANNIINILKLFFFLFFSCSLSTSHCVNMDNLKSGDTLNSYFLKKQQISLSLHIHTLKGFSLKVFPQLDIQVYCIVIILIDVLLEKCFVTYRWYTNQQLLRILGNVDLIQVLCALYSGLTQITDATKNESRARISKHKPLVKLTKLRLV